MDHGSVKESSSLTVAIAVLYCAIALYRTCHRGLPRCRSNSRDVWWRSVILLVAVSPGVRVKIIIVITVIVIVAITTNIAVTIAVPSPILILPSKLR